MALSPRVQSYVLTGNATPQLLDDLIPGSDKVIWVELTAYKTNATPIYHAGRFVDGSALSATNYGGFIPAPTAGVPVAPYKIRAHNGSLGNWQVLIATGEKLCLTALLDI